MTLIITVLISSILSFIFSLRFKKSLILLLTITIPSVILLEILITKDIAAFYYRYYYHWLFLIPILLALPFSFIREKKNRSAFLIIIFLVWGYLLIRFPVMSVLQNIKYLNTDSMWFDSFSKKYALHQTNIYDYIDWRYPKTKGIIKWCEDREIMTNLYTLDPKLRFYDDERGLHMFFIKCNYQSSDLGENKTPGELSEEFINTHLGGYYISLEPCHPSGSQNPFTNKIDVQAYEVNQILICSSQQVGSYLYVLPGNR